MKKIIILLISVLIFLSSQSAAGLLDLGRGVVKSHIRYNAGVGYSMPLGGYDGYENNPMFSFKVDVVRKQNLERDKLSYRFGIDYLMMMVPKGTYGITEDIFYPYAGLTYAILPGRKIVPFCGMGMGLYLDWIRVDMPALSKSSLYKIFGVDASLGAEFKVGSSLILIPEFKYYMEFVSVFNLS
ncbi:MAG: hypothetical protein PF545_04110 [Elusimicrobia bacterium]|jgi:hypothetical protein|nr:hypothetical protein [Elusimicrobiota bacterium]